MVRPAAVAVAAALFALVAGCGGDGGEGAAAQGGAGGDDPAFESDRTRPTDASEHSHDGEDSALAPRTVQPADIAELGDGVAPGGELSMWIGVNMCGRFLDIPPAGPVGGLSTDAAGRLAVAPSAGDDAGHDVTVADVMELLDLQLGTAELAFGEQWAPKEVALAPGAEPTALAGTSFATGDGCGEEQGEVQLWYYTPEAVDTGEDVRMVVTDPEDVPLVGDGAALTVAFAPTSSLPTLPPAAMLG